MIRAEGEDFGIGDAPRVLTHAQVSNDAIALPDVHLLRRAQPSIGEGFRQAERP